MSSHRANPLTKQRAFQSAFAPSTSIVHTLSSIPDDSSLRKAHSNTFDTTQELVLARSRYSWHIVCERKRDGKWLQNNSEVDRILEVVRSRLVLGGGKGLAGFRRQQASSKTLFSCFATDSQHFGGCIFGHEASGSPKNSLRFLCPRQDFFHQGLESLLVIALGASSFVSNSYRSMKEDTII